jgi:ATP-dependent helicase YprA (DUF1998 family)
LEIESGEILAEYRPALNHEGAAGKLIEVFLYDTLAGGAGFSPQLVPRGDELFNLALSILEDCPEACDASCYRCLRSFRNRLDHSLLDRHLGAQLLRHIIHDEVPQFSRNRATQSLRSLIEDLERQLAEQFEIFVSTEAQCASQSPLRLRRKNDGRELAIDIHSSIAPRIPILGPANAGAYLVDELKVRGHLGAVVREITDQFSAM